MAETKIKAERLIEKMTGDRQLSDTKIQQIVVGKAIEMSKLQEDEQRKSRQKNRI